MSSVYRLAANIVVRCTLSNTKMLSTVILGNGNIPWQMAKSNRVFALVV